MQSQTPQINKELAYFLGLITGRGSFETSKKIIVLEFPYAKPLEGIPYCPVCNEIMKGFTDKQCLTHGVQKPAFRVGPFDQQFETELSIKNIVIPILQKITHNIPLMSHATTTHGGRTFVEISFKEEQNIFDWIAEQFDPYTNYNSFEIPQIIHDLKLDLKKEYVSGITDTAGFPKWANFFPAMFSKEHKDRARMYFQFVRNWKLPVQFCNLLETEMDIPIDTIRWGHPNIDDSSRKDYDKTGYTMFREHQLKIFAENLEPIFHKFEYKRKILEELYNYNISIGFQANEPCTPPKSVKVAVYHPGENDPRFPSQIKGEHFDAFWQICWKMGCNLCNQIANPEYAYLKGKDEKFSGNIADVRKELDKKRHEKYASALVKRPQKIKKTVKKRRKTITEADTYAPLQKWLNDFLSRVNPRKQIISEIVATTTLSKLTGLQHIPKIVELVQDLEIRPDVVGFVNDAEMTFIESKITVMNLANVGQLVGYCLIADPEHAFLISTKPVSAGLKKILISYPELLSYNRKKLQIGFLDMKTGNVKLENI